MRMKSASRLSPHIFCLNWYVMMILKPKEPTWTSFKYVNAPTAEYIIFLLMMFELNLSYSKYEQTQKQLYSWIDRTATAFVFTINFRIKCLLYVWNRQFSNGDPFTYKCLLQSSFQVFPWCIICHEERDREPCVYVSCFDTGRTQWHHNTQKKTMFQKHELNKITLKYKMQSAV